MSLAIWIVSDDAALAETLGLFVRSIGRVTVGAPALADFEEAGTPDLIVAVGAAEGAGRRAAWERLLAFVGRVPHRRRAPQPLLFVDVERDAIWAGRLIDDRPVGVLEWPAGPDAVLDAVLALVARDEPPPTLRERSRRAWVSGRVERLYAGIDLPPLRLAVAPQNAHRPVLFCGERGTGRSLLARYVHFFAEPARDEFVVISCPTLGAGEIERAALEATAGQRVTVLLDELGDAPPERQVEVAELLGASGALAIEPIRWIASVRRARTLVPALRELAWIRVDLPALRDRDDAESLITDLASELAERRGISGFEVTPAALARLLAHTWPGNLRELETCLDASCERARGGALGLSQLVIAGAPLGPLEPERGRAEAGALDEDLLAQTDARFAGTGEHDADATEDAEQARDFAAEFARFSAAELTEADHTAVAGAPPSKEVAPAEAPISPGLEAERDRAPASGEGGAPTLAELLGPLARELREPLIALRTYAGLIEQRPEDAEVRREFAKLAERDLAQVETSLARLEQFAAFGPPQSKAYDLSAALATELEMRQAVARERSLVVLRELDYDAPPVYGDPDQVRFAIGGLLDRALRMVPFGGDLYVGSLYHPAAEDAPARHRVLIRFHSPEEVLIAPAGSPDAGTPSEVVLARALIERAGGAFAVDASGAQDNVILIEL